MRRRSFLALGIFAACALLLFPLWWMLVTAVADPSDIRRYPPVFLPATLDFDAFRTILFDRPMLRWIANSAVVAALSTAMTMVLGVLGGYALSRFSSRPIRAAGMGILVAKMIPTTLLVIPLYVLFREFGMLATLASAALAHCTVTIPFAIWMLKAYFDSIPAELEEAAAIDGTTPLGALWRIVLPRLVARSRRHGSLCVHPVLERVRLLPHPFAEPARELDGDHRHRLDQGRIHHLLERDHGRLGHRRPAHRGGVPVARTLPRRRPHSRRPKIAHRLTTS